MSLFATLSSASIIGTSPAFGLDQAFSEFAGCMFPQATVLPSRKLNAGDINRNKDRIWNRCSVRLPAQRPPLRGDLDSGKILVVGHVMRGRCAAGDGRDVVHPAKQAVAIDMEDLFGAVRCNVIRKDNPEQPAFFAVVIPRLDFFRLKPGQREDEGRVEVIPHRVTAEIGEIQIVPRGFNGMAGKGRAGICSTLEGLSVERFDRGVVRGAYAAHARADEGPIADPLVPGVGSDVNVLESVRPTL